MKQKISIVLILTLGLLVALPSAGYSWRHYGHYGYYRHGYYNGWAPAAIIAGGIITGAILVSALSTRQYYYPQQVVYVNPPPAPYYYPPVNQPYAAPDPNFVAQYGKQNPSGEWITVPGQQVGNTWVPSHKVHVPSNP
jgi:hypothetical protein